MSRGVPLTDDDRASWLLTLSRVAAESLSTTHPVAIVACSALKIKYRDIFRHTVDNKGIKLLFAFLQMSENKAGKLVIKRSKEEGHFMPSTLVKSQYNTLEVPGIDERKTDCVVVDADQGIDSVKESLTRIVGSWVLGSQLAESSSQADVLNESVVVA
jgi:gluconokinase